MQAIIITPCLKNKISDTVNIGADDFIICADNSFPKTISQGITPHLIIGDFDTGTPIPFPGETEIQRYPIEKDDSDTMLCVKEAARRGFTSITVAGGLSGRLDHTFANIQMLAYGASQGLDITVTDGENEAFLLRPGKTAISKKEGFSLSLFSYTEKTGGISLKGVKYPLENGELTNLFPLGLSNEIKEAEAEISFTHGLLLVIISKLN